MHVLFYYNARVIHEIIEHLHKLGNLDASELCVVAGRSLGFGWLKVLGK
jgi:hypothetical protein